MTGGNKSYNCIYNDNFQCDRITDFIESLDDMIFIFDEDGKILRTNNLVIKNLGYSEQEIKNMSLFDIRNPLYSKELKNKIDLLFEGKIKSCDIPLKAKDGKEMNVITKVYIGKYIKNREKCIAYAFCKDYDIILDYEEKIKKIFHSNAYAISISDIETGALIDVNERFVQMSGYDRNDIIGRKSVDIGLLTLSDRAVLIEELKKYGTIKNITLKYKTKYDELRYGEFSGDYIKLNDNEYLILFIVDVTENRENTENYMVILESIPYMVLRVRSDGLILNIKPGMDDNLKDPDLKKFIGKDIYSLPIDDHIKIEILETIERVLRNGVYNEHQYPIKNKSGEKRHLYTRTSKSGKENEVIIMVKDVTDEINLQSDLRNAKDNAENLIKMANVIVVELDENGTILFFNEAAEKITGYKKDEAVGKNWFNFMIPPEDKIKMMKFMTKMRLNFAEEDRKHENEIITKSGQRRFIVWRNNVIMKNKDIEGFVSFGVDITDRKVFEEELIKAKEKAEESDKMKLEFLANMSHDLRTPMNAIIGFSDLLKNNNLTKTEKNDYINTIINNGKFLMALIDDIIDVSKIDTNSLKIEKKEFEINKLLEELRLSYVKQMKDKKIDIIIDEDINKNIVIYSDKYRMRQILMNLIGNAIKFTKDGYVKFGYKMLSDKLMIYVEDTGVGISEENKKIIFERFTQLSNTGHKFKGAGLGLSITKSLIKLLGLNNIEVESELGKGSKFYFYTPYIIRTFDYDEYEGTKEKNHKKSTNLKGKCILLVEDDKDSRYIISKHLFKTNVSIIECWDGNEVMGIIKNNKIDLVLLDIGLPGKSGYKLIKEIKEYDDRLPIIVESALAMPDQKNKAYELGCDDYITKPISQSDLLFRIDRLI